MEPDDWEKIEAGWVELSKDLDAKTLSDQLVQDGIFFANDCDRVLCEPTTDDKARKFLKILKCKHGAYGPFYRALERYQPFLAQKLAAPAQKTEGSLIEHLLEVYEESSGDKVLASVVIKTITDFTGKPCNVSCMQKYIEQAFQHAEFEVKRRKTKSICTGCPSLSKTNRKSVDQCVLHLKKRDCPRQPKAENKDSDHTTGDVEEQPKLPGRAEVAAMTTDKLAEFLRLWFLRTGIGSEILDTFQQQAIDGSVFLGLTETDMKEILPSLKFGHRHKLISLVEVLRNETDSPKEDLLEEFDSPLKSTSSYKQHHFIRGKEAEVTNMIDPVHKFVGAQDCSEEKLLLLIAEETVQFTAACLNRRTNGTIHFGIKEDGEILGINTEKQKCRRKIMDAVESCFFPDQHDIIKQTMRPARCVDVLQATAGVKLYIVEIDVVPSFHIINEEAFFVRLSMDKKKKRCETMLLFLEQDSIKKLSGEEMKKYMEQKHSLSQERNRREMETLNKEKQKNAPNLKNRFEQLFCGGDTSLEGDIYHVLICGKPDEKSKSQINEDNFGFLKMANWTAVLDLDDSADGSIHTQSLYSLYENDLSKTAEVHTTDDFDPHNPGNDDTNPVKSLFDDLSTAQHVPWLFTNGYVRRKMKSLTPVEWKKTRSTGFKEVVRFFHKQLPKDRVVVVILLLSKDSDVLVEVCDEICGVFDNQWMVVAEDHLAAESLKRELLRRNVEKTALEDRFVVGVPWNHVSLIVQGLTGPVLEKDCLLSTSSGAPCRLHNKIRD